MPTETKYISSSQQRVLRTMKALFGHEVTGITSNELAKQLDTSSDRAFKDLKNLEEAGMAEQLTNKNWRLAPAFGREAIKVLNALETANIKLKETASRYGIAN